MSQKSKKQTSIIVVFQTMLLLFMHNIALGNDQILITEIS